MEKKLYPWQEDCLQKWFSNRSRGMVQAATGSGKTLLALTAASRLEQQLARNLLIRIVVPTGALMRQWERAIKGFLASSEKNNTDPVNIRKKIGLCGAGCRSGVSCKYMIYVINSARYELARQILSELQEGQAVLLIADECHRYESSQNRLIFEFLPYAKPYEDSFFSLGLSASLPAGQAQSYLASVLGRKIYSYDIRRASELHTVCPYDIFHIGLPFHPSEYAQYQELSDQMIFLYRSLLKFCPSLRDMSRQELYPMLQTLTRNQNKKLALAASSYLSLTYRRKSLVCLASARISCAVELLERLPSREKILIFGERISQADELYRLLQKNFPGKVGICHSQRSAQANKNALNGFRSGESRILIACKSMDEGIDIPEVSVGIILSGTSMQRQRVQRLGRIIRNAEGKKRAALYYLHLFDTAEDRCFLPDSGETYLIELTYLPRTHSFSNPSYDKACEDFLTRLKLAGADVQALAEARRCLLLGSVRSDWLEPPAYIDQRIKEQTRLREKNYWICMKQLANTET